MTLKLACADFTFPLLPHQHALDLIAMLGFKGVDIGLFEDRSHLRPSREFRDLRRAARGLKRKLDGCGLKASDVFLQMDLDCAPYAVNHPRTARRRKARDWYLRTLEYAAECNGRHVTIVPGVYFEEESRRDSWSRAVDELSWRMEQARPYGIVVGIEAHVGSIASRPKPAVRLVESVPGLTLTLDYTHFVRQGTPDAEVEPLIPYASHFHARGGRRGRLQEGFARNTIDYRRVFKAMKAANYPGWIGIEYVWIDWEYCNECDNLSETIQFRDLFRSLIGE